jgi:hypothetical protein
MSIEIWDTELEELKLWDSDVTYVYVWDNLVYDSSEEESE